MAFPQRWMIMTLLATLPIAIAKSRGQQDNHIAVREALAAAEKLEKSLSTLEEEVHYGQIGLEVEIQYKGFGLGTCAFNPPIGDTQYEVPHSDPGIFISGDQIFEDNTQQLELITRPFDCNAVNVGTVIQSIKDIVEDIPNWVAHGVLEQTVFDTLMCNVEKRLFFGWQATLDMEATRDRLTDLRKYAIAMGPYQLALNIYDTCIDVAKVACKSKTGCLPFFGTTTHHNKLPLFFKVLQGLMQAGNDPNTIKDNDRVLFKFSYVTAFNLLSDEYQTALVSASRSVRKCVLDVIKTKENFDVGKFTSWWDSPDDNDTMKAAFKTEILPVIVHDEISRVAVEFREHGEEFDGRDGGTKLARICQALNPEQ